MASKFDDVTAEVAKEFDTYYRDYFWDEINEEPNAKKMKLAELEPDCVKLDADDAVAIAIASGDDDRHGGELAHHASHHVRDVRKVQSSLDIAT